MPIFVKSLEIPQEKRHTNHRHNPEHNLNLVKDYGLFRVKVPFVKAPEPVVEDVPPPRDINQLNLCSPEETRLPLNIPLGRP